MKTPIVVGLGLVLVLWVLVRIYPAAAACALARQAILSNDQKTLLEKAKQRIESRFGPVQSKPIIIFFAAEDTFWPLRLNTFGSTSFLGYKTCVAIGPDGDNIDVTAHELMHAEIESRVSFRRRFTELPIWFDEGLAMQVDDRTRFDLEPPVDTRFVQDLESARSFFGVDGDALTHHYAAAKSAVKKWRIHIGDDAVFPRLERMGAGETFERIWLDK